MEHGQARVGQRENPSGREDLDRDAGAPRGRAQPAEERRLVGARGEPHLADRQLFDHRQEPENVVGVRMRRQDPVETRDSPIEQLRQQARPAEVRGLEIERTAAVDEQRPPRPPDENRISLPDVERLDRKTGLGAPGSGTDRQTDEEERGEDGARNAQPERSAAARASGATGESGQRRRRPKKSLPPARSATSSRARAHSPSAAVLPPAGHGDMTRSKVQRDLTAERGSRGRVTQLR